MSDFENFLCFSSATAQRCGTGTAEARDRIALLPPQFPFHTAAPSQRKNKESFQNRSYHVAIDERNEKRI